MRFDQNKEIITMSKIKNKYMINDILKKKVIINDKDPIIDELLLFAIIPFLRGKKNEGEKK